MISAWWLFAIVPMGVLFGMLLACLIFANGRDEHHEDS